MIQTKFLLVMFVGLTWLIIAPLTASAEWFGELYGGAAYTQSEDVTGRIVFPAGLLDGTVENADFDISFPVVGGRIGYWNVDAPWAGLALDAFHFRPNIDSQTVTATGTLSGVPFTGLLVTPDIDLSVTALSLDVMFRSVKTQNGLPRAFYDRISRLARRSFSLKLVTQRTPSRSTM